ncbi:MAG: hypothetical protein M0Z30_02175 [Actinomycetota bacterium]|nr:hypothetical protein [Actinomycetota bacterium]
MVGTTTVAGTGGLIAWVSDQSGMKTAATTVSTHPVGTTLPATASKSDASTRDTRALSALQRQLSAEEATLQALQGRVAALAAQARSKSMASTDQGSTDGAPDRATVRSTATSGGGNTGSGGAMTPLPALSPLPTIPTITIPAPAPVAAPPPVNATTGASHALP